MDEWIRIVGPGADTRRPEENVAVLCYDEPSKRLFVGSWDTDVHPGSGHECWCDEECTYAAVTHWQALETPRG
jgi:hypothetical protein